MRIPMLFLSAALVGCGAEVVDAPPDTGKPDTGSAASEGGVETATNDAAVDVPIDTAGITLDNVCEILSAGICASRTQECCTATAIKFDFEGCKRPHALDCQKSVEAAKAGRATLNPAGVQDCIAAWQEGFARCRNSYFDVVNISARCGAVFNGTTPKGQPCSSNGECVHPDGGAGFCNSSKCGMLALAPLGQPCGSNGYVCDGPSLYCDENVCKAVTPIGGACADWKDDSCGFANGCKDMKCTEMAPAGATCTEWYHCASRDCRMDKCTDPLEPLATPLTCYGG